MSRTATGSTYRRLLAYGQPYLWPTFLLAFLFNLGYGASTGVVPLVIRYLFDQVLPSADRNRLYAAPVVILVVIGLRALCQWQIFIQVTEIQTLKSLPKW
ncbi:MAG: hypothetical protein R6U00_07095 [Prochlorococcaceae cyanobacterium]